MELKLKATQCESVPSTKLSIGIGSGIGSGNGGSGGSGGNGGGNSDCCENVINNFTINNYYTTSSDCLDIPTVHPTTVTLTVGTDLGYTIGQSVTIYYDSTHYFIGIVQSYDPDTGELVVESVSNVGTGNYCTWSVSLTGTFGMSVVVTTDSNTIDFSGAGSLLSPLTASVIIGSEDNTIDDIVVWNGTELKTRNVETIAGDIIQNICVSCYSGISTDCIDIPTIHPTQITMNVTTGLSYESGDTLTIYADSTHYFTATVVSYDSFSGVLVVDSVSNVGTGSYCAWSTTLTSLFGLSAVITLDSTTIDMSGSGTLSDPLLADVILAGECNGIIERSSGLWSLPVAESYLITGGDVTWVGPNYDFEVAPLEVVVSCATPCEILTTTPISLSASDPTYNRYDVIVVDSSCNITVLEGTPSPAPVEPYVDTSLYFKLATIFVAAGTTSPVTEECIYQEDAEWTTTVGGTNVGTINPASTNNPYAGTKDVEGTGITNGDTILFDHGTTVIPMNWVKLAFAIRSKGDFSPSGSITALKFQFVLGSTPVGSPVILQDGNYNFDSTITTSYQTIEISMLNFGLGTLETADGLLITALSSDSTTNGWYIDNVCLQASPFLNPTSQSLNYTNYLTKSGNKVEAGGYGDHDTTFNTTSTQFRIYGGPAYRTPFETVNSSNWEVSPDVQSWRSAGSLNPADVSYYQSVRMRRGYNSDRYRGSIDYPNFFGPVGEDAGYYDSVNLRSVGSYGTYSDDILSKWAVQFWHTFGDGNTKLISWFGGAPGTGSVVTGAGAHLGNKRLFTIHTTGQLEATKYGVGTFLDNTAPYLIATTASGAIVELDPSTITGATYTVSNGLTETPATNFVWGGTLTGNTTINQATKSITFNDSNGSYFISNPTNNYFSFGNGTAFGTTLIIDEPGGINYLKILQSGVRVFELDVTNDKYTLGNQDGGAGTLLIVDDNAGKVILTNQVNFQDYGVGTYTGTLAYLTGVTATGDVIEVSAASVGSDTNFALNNLTANANRTHTFGAFTTEITYNSLAGASGFKLSSTSTAAASNAQKLFEASLSGTNATSAQQTYAGYFSNTHDGTTSTNYGIYATALNGTNTNIAINGAVTSGTAVKGDATTGIGVQGTSSSSVGVWGISSSNYGVAGNTVTGTAAGSFTSNPSTNSTVVSVLKVERSTSHASFGAAGIGASIDFYLETDTGSNNVISNQIISKWTTPTNAAETSEFSIVGRSAGTSSAIFTLAGNGQTTLNKYGVNTFSGTPAYLVGPDTSGVLKEVAVSTGLTMSSSSLTWDGVKVRKNSAGSTYTRRRINFIEGSAVTLTVADDGTDDEVDVTISFSGGGTATLADGDYGDITVSGSGTVMTIDNDVVTDAKLRNSGALSVIGRSANSSGDPADISATASTLQVLRVSGTTLGFGTIDHTYISDWTTEVTLQKATDNGNITTNDIILRVANPSSGVFADSPALYLKGKGNNGGTITHAQWEVFSDVADTSGNSAFTIANRTSVTEAGSFTADYFAVDNDYNIYYHGSSTGASTVGAVVLSQNASVSGSNSAQIGGQNTVIESSCVGIFSGATDSHFYNSTSDHANYSSALGDAHSIYGYASFTAGYGNYNYAKYGFAMGNTNTVGYSGTTGGTANTYESSGALGQQIRVSGNYAWGIGRAVAPNADGVIIIGHGVNATNTRLTNSEARAIVLGANSTIGTLIVHEASGTGTAGITEVAGHLEINTTTSIANDDALTQVLVRDGTSGQVKYRNASSLTGSGNRFGYTAEDITAGVNRTVDFASTYSFLFDNITELGVDGTLKIYGQSKSLVTGLAVDGAPYSHTVGYIITDAGGNNKLLIDTNGTTGYVHIGDRVLGTTVIGVAAQADRNRNIAIGVAANATGTSGFDYIAIGSAATSKANDSTVIGAYAINVLASNSSTIVGSYSNITAAGASAVLIGYNNTASKDYVVGVGANQTLSGEGAVGLSESVTVSGDYGINIGAFGTTAVSYGIGIGYSTSVGATHTNSIAIGKSVSTTQANEMILGGSTIAHTLIRGAETGAPTYFYGETATGYLTKRTLSQVASDIGGITALTGDVTASGPGSVTATVNSASSAFAFTGDITPSQITATQNDYNPTGLSTATVLRLSTDASRFINGLAGGSDGRIIIIRNVGSNDIVFTHDNAGSTAANRFQLSGISQTQVLTTNQSIVFQYDATISRWSPIATSSIGIDNVLRTDSKLRASRQIDMNGTSFSLASSNAFMPQFQISIDDAGGGTAKTEFFQLGNSGAGQHNQLYSKDNGGGLLAKVFTTQNGVSNIGIGATAVSITDLGTGFTTSYSGTDETYYVMLDGKDVKIKGRYVILNNISTDNTAAQVYAKDASGHVVARDISSISGGSGIVRSVNSVSGATSAGSTASTDYIYLCSNTMTITLPTAVGNTNRYTITRVGTGTVSIATTSSQTIDGTAAPLDLVVQYASVELISDGSNWIIIASHA